VVGSSSTRRLGLLLLAAGVVAAVAAPLTHAGPASGAGSVAQDATVGLELDVGVQDRVTGGRRFPVLVTIRADRPVDGTLTIDIVNGPPAAEVHREVEVAAGTTKELRLVMSGLPWFGLSLRAQLLQDGRVVARQSVNLQREPLGSLVGVLPDLAGRRALPPTASMRGEVSTARLGALVPEQLALGVGGVEIFDVIAGTPRDLVDLDAAGRAVLLDWVALGGRLLLDGTADELAAAGVPPDWVPSVGTYAFAGLGEVRLAPGLGTGAWSDHLDMTRQRAADQLGMFDQLVHMGPQFSSSGGLASDAGLRLASLGVVIVVLLAYVVVVGPITFVVLKRRRRLAGGWIVVPALALACSLVVVVAGSGLRGNARAAHATVVSLTDDGRTAWRTEVIAVQRGSGQVGVRVPDGAGARGTDQWDGMGGTLVQSGVGDAQRLEAPADPGQAVVLPVSGAGTSDWHIDIEATSDGDDVVRGTFRHDLPVALHDVAVLAGGSDVLLGTVEPGAEVAFEVRNVDVLPIGRLGASGWRDRTSEQGFMMFGGPGFGGPGFGDAGFGMEGEIGNGAAIGGNGDSVAVQLGAWSRFEREEGLGFRSPANVRVVGWTRELAAPVTLRNGEAVKAGRTAVTAVAPVVPVDRVTTSSVRRELVAGDAVRMDGFDANANANGNVAPGVMRFVLPPQQAVAPGELRMTVPAWVRGVQLYVDGGGWVTVADGVGGEVAVPPGAVRDGVILAKFLASFDVFGELPGWTIREVS
jgi:hypothetical protein